MAKSIGTLDEAAFAFATGTTGVILNGDQETIIKTDTADSDGVYDRRVKLEELEKYLARKTLLTGAATGTDDTIEAHVKRQVDSERTNNTGAKTALSASDPDAWATGDTLVQVINKLIACKGLRSILVDEFKDSQGQRPDTIMVALNKLMASVTAIKRNAGADINSSNLEADFTNAANGLNPPMQVDTICKAINALFLIEQKNDRAQATAITAQQQAVNNIDGKIGTMGNLNPAAATLVAAINAAYAKAADAGKVDDTTIRRNTQGELEIKSVSESELDTSPGGLKDKIDSIAGKAEGSDLANLENVVTPIAANPALTLPDHTQLGPGEYKLKIDNNGVVSWEII